MAFSIKDFTARINWRQIIIHALAFLFFMYAFETLSYLFHLKIMNAARSTDYKMYKILEDEGITTADLSLFLVWTSIAGSIGLLTAFSLSIILSIKRRWLWFNSILSFLLILILIRTPLWDNAKYLFNYPGRLFSSFVVKFLVNGGLFLLLGLILFFSKPITRFISGKPTAD